MGTDCKSAAFSFGGSNPPAPTKNSGIQWVPEFLFYLSCKRDCKGGFEQQQRRPLPAAETGRSCWGCGQQDARAAQGTMQPLGAPYTARLAQSTRAHQKTATYQNTLRFCFTILCLAVFASPSHQSSWARILFCTISPAGVRARMRPSKVAYPARTQFCTKASCAVENCLPYRVL